MRFNSGGGGSGSPGPQGPAGPAGPVVSTQVDTLYVSTPANGGSDSNPGTALLPFATIQAALNSLLRVRRHPATVIVGPGTFAGAFVQGFQFETADPSVGAYLQIQGTMVNATPATGTATGTTSASGAPATGEHGQVVDATQTWTVNDLRGKLCKLTSGALSGQYYPIESNTATTLTLASIQGVLSGVTYTILDWATIISGTGVFQPVTGLGNAPGSTATAFGFVFQDATQAVAPGSVRVENFKFTTPRGVLLASAYRPDIKGCSFSCTTTVNCSMGQNTLGAYLSANVFALAASGSVLTQTLLNAPALIALQNNVVLGTGNGSVTGGGLFWQGYCSGNYYTGLAYGWRARKLYISGDKFETVTGAAIDTNLSGGTPGPDGEGQIQIGIAGACKFTGCGTAVRLAGGVRAALIAGVDGGGNTIALDVLNGSVAQIATGWTVSGTTELRMDGQAETLVNFRTFVPKLWPNKFTGSQIRQDDTTSWTVPDASGSPGNATQHTLAGRAAIASGASSCVITNNRLKAGSVVHVQGDGTAVLGRVVAAGSLTVSLAAPAGATAPFTWDLVAS
jgi:hypothetical protein